MKTSRVQQLEQEIARWRHRAMVAETKLEKLKAQISQGVEKRKPVTGPRIPKKKKFSAFLIAIDQLGMKDIVESICLKHGTTMEAVHSNSRFGNTMDARTETIQLIKKQFPKMTLQAIGDIFGLHHSSILHHLRKELKNPWGVESKGCLHPFGDMYKPNEFMCRSCGKTIKCNPPGLQRSSAALKSHEQWEAEVINKVVEQIKKNEVGI